jgi:uncharacterized protein (DUF849 family)
MKDQYDPKQGMYSYTPEELAFWPMQADLLKWDIPEKVAIQCAISGGGARITTEQNPYHPGDNLDHVLEAADEVLALEVGPSAVHFDNDFPSLHTRDGKELLPGDSYMYVVKPLLEKYGWGKLCAHINCLRGDMQQQMLPVMEGICELTYTHPRASASWLKRTLAIHKEHDIKVEIGIHVNSEIELAERTLIRTGLMPNPNLWCLLFGLPVKGPRWHFEYIPNAKAMCQHLVNAVERIREIDPEAFITVLAAGRAARYMVTLATLLGLHIRVGMEDTVFQYPHKDDPCKNNAEEVRWAIDMTRMLGREVMTPNELRKAVGIKPKHDYSPKGKR